MTVPPCDGLSVVEIAVGVSDLGLGLAGALPGKLLADLGADVVRIVGRDPVGIDAGLTWSQPWHGDKSVVATDDPAEIRRLVAHADVALVYGPEALVEDRGLGSRPLCAAHPRLVVARCRPSRTASGEVDDYALLVEARSGFCTQLEGHRAGPIFVDVRAPGAGAGFVLTTSVLALLTERARTGVGGWAETSLYDGMLATLGCMIGRSERAAPEVEGYWEHGSTFPNFLYRCADGELIQVWFGGKGMYPALLEVLGDEPSEQGYYADQVTGALNERAVRWREVFTTRARHEWIERLRAAGVACEPVLGPGDALGDPHLAEVGLARRRTDGVHDDVVVGSPVTVAPLHDDEEARLGEPVRPLAGLRVADFSAFVAGPLGAQVLADLGADVVKVEPPGGEAMRAAAYAVAACQRGKRSLALDIRSPDARPVVEGLLHWADVVLHNFRVGVSTRLGIDEAQVARHRPDAVYCHASGFGPTGPRALSPANDALMQALTGFESAVGGEGNDPLAGTWIPLDMSGGWLAAIGTLAGLYARATTGRGQRVATSLLGAGMLLQSGEFVRDGALVRGPRLDGGQTGYGPGYRIYRAADGEWFALVVPDEHAWRGVRAEVGDDLVADYVPLRVGGAETLARQAEATLEAVFAGEPAHHWVRRLRDAGALVEPVVATDRDAFRRGILDDPVNRQLGRVASYETDGWGRFEQIGPLLRHGPDPVAGPCLMLPGIGEHTDEVLRDLGVEPDVVAALLDAGVAVQLGRGTVDSAAV